jgi:hypothetical protein
VNVAFLAVLLGWVAVVALLTALVAITAPALGRLVARIAPRLVWEASFIATWLVVKAGR